LTVSAWIDLDADGAVCGVNQSSIRGTAMCRIERDRRQAAALERLPLVDDAVAVGVFLGARREFL
jgi:hypothetical protein